MTIKEILKLGEMGYTKDEIDKMDTAPETNVNEQIAGLESQIKSLKEALEVSNTREPVTNEPAPEGSTVDYALKILAGGTNE